jgi:hypothetical protein
MFKAFRKGHTCVLAGLSALLAADLASADVPENLKCTESKRYNCVRGDVFVLDGLIEESSCKSRILASEGFKRTDCIGGYRPSPNASPTTMNWEAAANKVADIIKAAGHEVPKWDQLVIFGVDTQQPAFAGGDAVGPIFFRQGGVTGVNDVAGIGLEKKVPRNPDRPWVGYITGGSTTTFGVYVPPAGEPDRRYIRKWPEPDPEGVKGGETRYKICFSDDVLCWSDWNGYQALAQASASMFGPFLRPDPELVGDNWTLYPGQERSECTPKESPEQQSLHPSIMIANDAGEPANDAGPSTAAIVRQPDLPLVNLKQTSGLGLVAMATDGGVPNRLGYGEPILTVCPERKANIATKLRPPHWEKKLEASGAVWKFKSPGQYYGQIRPLIWNSFLDMDGSLMGGGANWRENGNRTASSLVQGAQHWDASPPHRGRSLHTFHPLELYLMGFMAIGEVNNEKVDLYQVTPSELIGERARLGTFSPTGGPTMGLPDYFAGVGNIQVYSEKRRRSFTLDQLLGNDPRRDPAYEDAPHHIKQLWVVVKKPRDDFSDVEVLNELHINRVIRWRKKWNQYFYMLARYRGRMVTTYDAQSDDSAYWEFMRKDDDEKVFKAEGGLDFTMPGSTPDGNSPANLSTMNVSTPGKAGLLRFTDEGPQQLPLRIEGAQTEEGKPLAGATNAVFVRMRVPRTDLGGPPPRKAYAEFVMDNGVKIRVPGSKDAFLSPDGKFHTYNADLTLVDGFDEGTYKGFTLMPSSEAIDCSAEDRQNSNSTRCLQIDYIKFSHIVEPQDAEDDDLDCDGRLRPDGWVSQEDNCPDLYNPDQEDADGNGVGDACQDFDSDTVPNLCDNCPTLANTRQKDGNNNTLGDVCDETQGVTGCFLQPDSVAGRTPAGGAGAVFGLAILALGMERMLTGRRPRRQ